MGTVGLPCSRYATRDWGHTTLHVTEYTNYWSVTRSI